MKLCTTINDLLPSEIIEKILKLLNLKEKCHAQLICRRWKGIIDNGNLLIKAAGKILFFVMMNEYMSLSFPSLERISCVIIAGESTVQVFNGDFETKDFPRLHTILASSIVMHNGTILVCGGVTNYTKCLQFNHGTWMEHSTLNEARFQHSVVATKTATFIFGGNHTRTTYEYLPKDSTIWLRGKNEIPGGFTQGCGIAVKSKQEIWLIGGFETEKRILIFNINDHTFQELPSQLNVERLRHRIAYIPNTNKIMITGGASAVSVFNQNLNSTEVLDTENGSVTMANPMNSSRHDHGIGAITINGEDKLAVFGGVDTQRILDSVELYSNQTGKWETSTIKLSRGRYNFGFLAVTLADIIKNKAMSQINANSKPKMK